MALPAGDSKLIQIVDAALADAARRSGEWLVCRAGCTQCCVGPFPISQLDAERLRAGLEALAERDPARAERVQRRAREYVRRLTTAFPGDARTGVLDEGRQEEFDGFADEEACPALDAETGRCDLYDCRPMTCREFGPPVRVSDEEGNAGFSVCELCFQGAPAEEVARCEMASDPEGLEARLIEEMERQGKRGLTLVGWAIGARVVAR
jgi:Fe-S-cluster containining protein